MHKPYKILSTKHFPKDIIAKYGRENVLVTAIDFIKTKACTGAATAGQIKALAESEHVVVFTSVNAVTAVAAITPVLNVLPWKIYCIGHATLASVTALFGKQSIAGSADDAHTLATVIAAQKIATEIIFFCGTSRRNELVETLTKHNIIVQEVYVYQTEITPACVDEDFDAILFFSPSAVRSFFKQNKPLKTATLFAIGNTTAAEIKRHANNTLITAETPDAIKLMKLAIEYF